MRTLVALIAFLHVAAVHAGTAADLALQHLDKGIAAYRLGDYATARTELDLARELAPDRPNPYRWLALTEAKQDDCKDAVASVESFLSRVPAGDSRVPEMTALRDECLHTMAQPPAPPPPAPPAEAAPSHTRWWLWTAIGAVAVTAVGVTYAITRTHETMLPPIQCDGTGCH